MAIQYSFLGLELLPFDTFGIGIFTSSAFWNLVTADIQVITSEGKLVIVFNTAQAKLDVCTKRLIKTLCKCWSSLWEMSKAWIKIFTYSVQQ